MISPIKTIKSIYNAFVNHDRPTRYVYYGGSSNRPDRTARRIQNERSIITSIYNRISVDSSLIDVKHVRLDDDGNYKETINDSLNDVLNKDANIDQTGRKLIEDMVYSMLDEGVVAVLPTETKGDPKRTDSYEILEARVCKIVEWYPYQVRIEGYNDRTGNKEQIVVEKREVLIIDNPFYSVMNEPNSTLQRAIRLLNQLDRLNEQISSDKMDLIIQLPFQIRSQAKKDMANERKMEIEAQLTGSKFGIAYIDGMEKVIQLNRPVENNLWNQYKELKSDLFNEMGMTMEILNGTADEKTMTNYYSRIIEPILTTITEEAERKWISKTARSQGQGIRFFRDPFKLIPVSQVAEMSDKLTRNEIMTSNEVRVRIGLKPSNDPKADMLVNSNLNQSKEEEQKISEEKKMQNSKSIDF